MKCKFKLTSVAIVLVLLLTLSLAACSPEAIYTVGSVRYTEGMVDYYYAACKYLYLSAYKTSGAKDTPEGWATLYGEKTHGERFSEQFRERLLLRATGAALFEGAGLTSRYSDLLKSMMQDAVDATFYYEDADSAREYSRILSAYGASYNDLKRLLLYECEYMLYFDLLFGTDGSQVLFKTEFADEVKEFYDTHYIHARIVAVESAEKKSAARDAYLLAGTDSAFDALVTAYAENENTRGFFYLYGQYDLSRVPFLTVLDGLAVGENATVTVDGVDYYVRRYATGEEYKDTAYNTLFAGFTSYAASYCYRAHLLSLAEDADFSFLDGLSPTTVSTCKEHNAIDHLERLY